jgi:hypothetical protein
MAIPSYKQININFEDKKSVFEQLALHQFGQIPYIINISHLTEQYSALKNIEQYFTENEVNNYPYPIYIISTIKNYFGIFHIFESIEACPSFFKQKIKQLNTKENKILQKIYLKQKNLNNMNGLNSKNIFKYYSQSHKTIYNLEKEKHFLDNLKFKLEKYFGIDNE